MLVLELLELLVVLLLFSRFSRFVGAHNKKFWYHSFRINSFRFINRNCLCSTTEQPEFNLLYTFFVSLDDLKFKIWKRNNEIFIAFRGTNPTSYKNLWANVDLRQVPIIRGNYENV